MAQRPEGPHGQRERQSVPDHPRRTQIMEPRIPIAAITDEFSPNLEPALDVMEEIGMTTVELRVVNGKNILDLTDDELSQVAGILASRGFQTVSIASPLLKCLAPGGGE